MRNTIFFLFILMMALGAPKVTADTLANSDFNPFPQMEQDMNNTDNETATPDQQQNDDTWPPANSDVQRNNE